MEVVLKETQSIWELEKPTAEDQSEDAAAHRVFTSKKSSCYRCVGKLSAGRHKGDTHHPTRKAHVVEPDEDLSDCQSSDDEIPVCVHKVANRNRYPKLTANLDIHGNVVKFEVDTGAEVSTIPAKTYRQRLMQITLQPTSVVLSQYDGTILPTLGELRAGFDEKPVSRRLLHRCGECRQATSFAGP